MKRVILSTSLILEPGTFEVSNLSLEQAWEWLNRGPVENFCGHETVKILGLEPDRSRNSCSSYDEALAIKTKERLEFGREYGQEEIEAIGVEFMLIVKR